MLCKVQLFCFLILISDYCCPECLVIVVACFVTRVCDSNEACHLKNSLCILEKPVSLKTLDKVLVEHPRATDWEEWLSYIAYSFFFSFSLLPGLMLPQTRPCPRGTEQADRSCGTKQSWILLLHPRQRAFVVAQPWATSVELWCWRRLRRKKAYSRNQLKMGSEQFTFIDQQQFFPLSVSHEVGFCRKEVTIYFWNYSSTSPCPMLRGQVSMWS